MACVSMFTRCSFQSPRPALRPRIDKGDALTPPPPPSPQLEKQRVRETSVSPCAVITSVLAEGPSSPPPPSAVEAPHLLRVEAARLLFSAWCELARDRKVQWMATDVQEIDPGIEMNRFNLRTLVIISPEQDPLGVVSCAVGVARWLLSDEYLARHALDERTRLLLATVLFMMQKMKTEESWDTGSRVALRVLACFLHPEEIGDWETDARVRNNWYKRMFTCEARLVTQCGFASVSDGPLSLYTAFEVALCAIHEASEIDDRGMVVGVGIVHFYIHAAHTNAERDVLEALGMPREVTHVGIALALIVLVTCRLQPHLSMCAAPRTTRATPWFKPEVRATALHLVRNATATVRHACCGAYADETSLAYSYVSPCMLSAVVRVLSALECH
jgi:hypothetical protein